jgi:glycosyltransferase involved in cell wall biosynthesis
MICGWLALPASQQNLGFKRHVSVAEKPKVSIILTSYNHAKFLRDSIESVLAQTFSDFELIIWDDESTDESWQIINSYTDARIRAFRNSPRKQYMIVEKAISEYAAAEYIAIHHSDDAWEPQKLAQQVAFLDENPQVGAVFSQAQVVDENGARFTVKSHFYYNVFEQPNRTRYEWLNYFFYHGNALCHPSMLIRKKCYDELGYYRHGLAQIGDLDMWVRLCLKYDIHVLPEKLVRFRVRANEANTSGNRPDVRVRGYYEFFQVYKNYCKIQDPKEFIEVFPAARKYFLPEGYDIGFALGMLALENQKFHADKLLGLELLFEALNDPERAQKIQKLYGFKVVDFVALTAENDVFSIEKVDNLTAEVQALTVKKYELQGILNSRAWKLVTILRKIRSWLWP